VGWCCAPAGWWLPEESAPGRGSVQPVQPINVAVDDLEAIAQNSGVRRPPVEGLGHRRGGIAPGPFRPAVAEGGFAGPGVALDRGFDGDRAISVTPQPETERHNAVPLDIVSNRRDLAGMLVRRHRAARLGP
jgi:hypothetical protein